MGTSSATIHRDDQDQPDGRCNAPVHGPLDLTGHEASWQDVDTLKEPRAPDEHQEQAHNGQRDSHEATRLRPRARPSILRDLDHRLPMTALTLLSSRADTQNGRATASRWLFLQIL